MTASTILRAHPWLHDQTVLLDCACQFQVMPYRQYMYSTMPESELPDTQEVAVMLARFACNNHTITDDEAMPIGM